MGGVDVLGYHVSLLGAAGLAANNFEGNARLPKGCPGVHCCRFTVMRFICCVAAVQGQPARSMFIQLDTGLAPQVLTCRTFP